MSAATGRIRVSPHIWTNWPRKDTYSRTPSRRRRGLGRPSRPCSPPGTPLPSVSSAVMTPSGARSSRWLRYSRSWGTSRLSACRPMPMRVLQSGFAQGFDTFLAPESEGSYPGDFAVPIAETVTRTALALLDERDLSRPFFLFLHYVDPHDPYLPHPGLLDSVEPSGRFDGSRRRLQEMDRTAPSDLTEADVERIKFLYAGEVKYADAWIGALLAGLRDRGLHDDTLIVVTADHGEGLWDHAPRGAPGEYGARAALPSNPALLSARRAPMIAPLRPRPPPWSSTSARRSSQVRRPIATLRSRSACHPSSISMRSTERDRRSQSVSLASRNSTLICCSLQKRVSTDRPKTMPRAPDGAIDRRRRREVRRTLDAFTKRPSVIPR